jgi:hypothetical protein
LEYSMNATLAKYLAAIAMSFMSSMPRAEIGTVEINVSAMKIGAPPADFDFGRTGKGETGRWLVVEDATATKARAIAQMSSDATNYRFPLAIYKPVLARDLEVDLRFKPVSGKVDQAGGIAVRLTSPDNYYVVRANALENNVRFYRVVRGKRQQIEDASAKVTSNSWHTLKLRAEGDRFSVSFDGKHLFTAIDRTFDDAGQFALWSKADSVTYFDQIVITPLR